MVLTAELFMLAVRTAFRLGKVVQENHDERVRAADYIVKSLRTGELDLNAAALQQVYYAEQLRVRYCDVFDLSVGVYQLLPRPDPGRLSQALAEGMNIIRPGGEIPHYKDKMATDEAFAVSDAGMVPTKVSDWFTPFT